VTNDTHINTRDLIWVINDTQVKSTVMDSDLQITPKVIEEM